MPGPMLMGAASAWGQDVTSMIVSHDSGFLDAVCSNIIHYEGRKLRLYRVRSRQSCIFTRVGGHVLRTAVGTKVQQELLSAFLLHTVRHQ